MSLHQHIFDTVPKLDGLGFWSDRGLDGRKVTQFLELSTQDVSRIAKVAQNSVRFDERMSPQVREHLSSIANICNLVMQHFESPEKTALWFKTENPLLGDVSPRDMIRYGRYKKLLKFVSEAVPQGGVHGSGPSSETEVIEVEVIEGKGRRSK